MSLYYMCEVKRRVYELRATSEQARLRPDVDSHQRIYDSAAELVLQRERESELKQTSYENYLRAPFS
jgi:hypothetical protein